MNPPKLTEVPLNLIEDLAKREEGTSVTTMRNALQAAALKADPVFVKRGASILVMEKSQFKELSLAFSV